jgi:hypothetical protein
MLPKENGVVCPRLEPNVNGEELVVGLLVAGSAVFCSLRVENPVLKSGDETPLKLAAAVMVVLVDDDVLGVPNAGIVPLAPKLKLGAVVAEPKLGSDGDTVVVVLMDPNNVMGVVLVSVTKLGISLLDVVTSPDSLLPPSEPKLKVGIVFNAVPNGSVDPEVLANCWEELPNVTHGFVEEPKENTSDTVVAVTVVVTVSAAAAPKLLVVTAAEVLLPNVGCDEMKLKLETAVVGFPELRLRCSAVVLTDGAVKPKTGFALSTAFVDI